MGRILQDSFADFAGGVVTSAESDRIPPNCSPRGYNSILASIGGNAVPQKREGFTTMNGTAITGATSVLGQFEYARLSSGSLVRYHLLAAHSGRVDWMNTSGTLTEIDATGLTHGDYYPDFAQGNNLAFIVNGQDKKKVAYVGTGLVLQAFGIIAPTTAPTLASGTGTLHNGTYEARVTYYSSTSGHESSTGVTSGTIAVTNAGIAWSVIPVSSDTQVTARKLYLRNIATMSNWYLITTLADNTTTTYTSNLADTSLTVAGPDTAENNPPPTGIKYVCWHLSRLFVATDTQLYYSKVGKPEAFDPDFYEDINPDDGQKITGLHSAHDVLIIFKTNSVYYIAGTDPATWEIKLLIPDIGSVSHRGVVTIEGLTYWWSEQGPVMWQGPTTSAIYTVNKPAAIGTPLIATEVQAVNPAHPELICAVADPTTQQILWAVPGASQSRNTLMLAFNYRLQRWASNRWDPMDACSLASINDANDLARVMLGGYAGQVFKYGGVNTDGVVSGTTTGVFTAAGTSHATITVSGAAFNTTGGGLSERYVTVVDSNGLFVDRQRIASNNATVLTLGTAVTGLTIGSVYTIIVGGPRFEWDTKWSDLTNQYINAAFVKKRFEFLYLETDSSAAPFTVNVALAFNNDSGIGQIKSFTNTAASATNSSGLWSATSYGTKGSTMQRWRIGRTGMNYRVRVWNYYPEQRFKLLSLQTRAEILRDTLG